MKLMTQLRRCRTGAVAIEFAIVAPIFFAMLFGVIETSRVFWLKQSLDEVAYSTARCMSVSSACATQVAQQNYAIGRAQALGIRLTSAMVTPTTGVVCKGSAGSNQVALARPIESPLAGFVPAMPSTLRATACFPVLA